jgi:hypothetical protein
MVESVSFMAFVLGSSLPSSKKLLAIHNSPSPPAQDRLLRV